MVNEYVLKSHHALAIDNLIQSVFNMHLDIDRKDIGETPEGTGQAEDYRLKLSPRKASQQYELNINQITSK
ncbi:hypothetical protein BUZ11_00705 [Staphylococcus gallinarum]|uniref:hypothetical protein n=1 Tax=Staphylococcus gallinarum TaxID=1293 RepID=UPI000E69B7DC|nr:hypothetical protein [Staphylococcus gallinarum]RIO84714.1 hypothetical protein BUZ11_00705 [Staphylococcus gallinarum]